MYREIIFYKIVQYFKCSEEKIEHRLHFVSVRDRIWLMRTGESVPLNERHLPVVSHCHSKSTARRYLLPRMTVLTIPRIEVDPAIRS